MSTPVWLLILALIALSLKVVVLLFTKGTKFQARKKHGYKSLWQLIKHEPDFVLLVILGGLAEDVWAFLKSLIQTNRRYIVLALTLLSFWAQYVVWANAHGDTQPLTATLFLLRSIGQIGLGILGIVIQFGSLFWFISRIKTEVVTPDNPGKVVTFADYKGQRELLKLVRQWVDLLKNSRDFRKMGGQLIRGILLSGPPGTGKTYLAKCMAGEGNVAFFSVEGSGFRGMFFGMDVLKVLWFCGKARSLARRYGACIAYIDEIDAVGASRGGVAGDQNRGGAGLFGGGSGALTTLLSQMDGMDENFSIWEKLRNHWWKRLGLPIPPPNWHVLYMGSTNRPEVLDSALLRPGRFDQKIVVEPPDTVGRREIIEYYLRKVSHNDSVYIAAMVADTRGATPSFIKSVLTSDAPRVANAQGRTIVTQRDIDQAIIERQLGIPHPIEEWSESQRRQVAYHEAGHAIAFNYLLQTKRLILASILRRGNALGYVLSVEKEELYAYPLTQIIAEIQMSLAGQVATQITTGEPWTGPSGDYALVRTRLLALVADGYWGPPISGNPEDLLKQYAEQIKVLLKKCEDEVRELLEAHRSELDAVAGALLEKESLFHDEILDVIAQAGGGWRTSTKETFPAPVAAIIAPTQTKQHRFGWIRKWATAIVILALLAGAAGEGIHQTLSGWLPTRTQAPVFASTLSPQLSRFKLVDETIYDTAEGVMIEVVVDINGATGKEIVSDIFTIYRWGRTHFAPVKCGKDYPPELCKIGRVSIHLTHPEEIVALPGYPNKEPAYAEFLRLGLDQVEIDKLLATTPPETITNLYLYHQNIVAITGGTGGLYESSPGFPIFKNLPHN